MITVSGLLQMIGGEKSHFYEVRNKGHTNILKKSR